MAVVGIARRLDKLEELEIQLAGERGTFHPRQCDLTSEDQIMETFHWIEETLGPISILINNAGVLAPTNLKVGSSELWKTTFDVNVLAVCICTKQAIQSMKTHNVNGHIIHVGSVVGHYVPDVTLQEPLFNVYPATKHAVVALAESLRKELNRNQSKIKISTISPGLTVSELYRDFDAATMEGMTDTPMLQSEDVANAIMFMLATPPGVQIQDIIIRAVGET